MRIIVTLQSWLMTLSSKYLSRRKSNPLPKTELGLRNRTSQEEMNCAFFILTNFTVYNVHIHIKLSTQTQLLFETKNISLQIV